MHSIPAGAVNGTAAGLRGPIMIKMWWSAVLRIGVSLTRHAVQRMGQRGISSARLQQALNDGKVIRSGGGTKTVMHGDVRVVVNSKTGKIITVTRAGGGGGGGGW